MSERAAWHGVYTATTLPFNDDYSINYDAFAEHVAWLAAAGTHGVAVNGSLGEYQTLSDEERARVVTTAIEAAPEGFGVMAGGAAYGTLQSVRWIEQAAEAGAGSVLLLPPNAYRADRSDVLAHYRAAAQVGLPIVAYNNPYDTRVDLTPDLLAELHAAGSIVAIKEFSGDPRRAYEIAELAPDLDLLIGADDVLLELGIAGAVGWVAGYPNAFPTTCLELYNLVTSGSGADLEKALPLYRSLHKLLRWDSKTEFVHAIKLSQDVVGRTGGICRPPRQPLPSHIHDRVVADTKDAIALGYS
ncbi:dihydrodipicolinate synthase family protein [Millisia brevis]|uniref:dihydrodipicolinate synthase family protein n=1 Tax=Millisia brevis TaxID=264148 RepID=UPI000834B4A0|nr:dihydrodipicolinate synthase family protein [Millisia brevis]